MAGTCALASLAGAAACLVRAREPNAERAGWRLLGWALGFSVWANVVMALVPGHPGLRGPGGVWVQGPSLAGLALTAAALLAWPWRSPQVRRKPLHVLGSALFVGSLLLLLWTFGTWGAGFRAPLSANLALILAAARLSVLAGIGLYLFGEQPGRIRGVLGFVLVNVSAGLVYTVLLQLLVERGGNGGLPFFSLSALAPLVLGLAAWSGAPVEVPAKGDPRNWDLLPYVPFILAGGSLLAVQVLHPRPSPAPMMGFLALTVLLVLRQYLLLLELRRTNSDLEERVRDRTRDLELLQTAMLRTERMNTVASLGAGISHDLNNLLGVVMATAETIEVDRTQGRLSSAKALERIRGALEKATALTGRLMGFGRKDAGHAQVVSLAHELALLQDLLRLLLPRSVEIRLEAAPGEFPVRTCRTHLEQVLVNLVSNARDAMPAGGKVTIRLDEIRSEGAALARIQVADNGPGLAQAVEEHLFEPFFTTKEAGKGTGLGLPSVKALVEGDGGTVAVRNQPGLGCTFILVYPMIESSSGCW
jgi:signal transduction histidine kinase